MPRKLSKRYSLSRGPGDASEWYWMLITGRDRWRRPSTVSSLRLMWLTSSSAGRLAVSTA